jgi:hypothetical protein
MQLARAELCENPIDADDRIIDPLGRDAQPNLAWARRNRSGAHASMELMGGCIRREEQADAAHGMHEGGKHMSRLGALVTIAICGGLLAAALAESESVQSGRQPDCRTDG